MGKQAMHTDRFLVQGYFLKSYKGTLVNLESPAHLLNLPPKPGSP